MKRKNIVRVLVALLVVAICMTAFTGCSLFMQDQPVGIVSIEKTSTSADGLVDTYTITYTDGRYTTFTVTNGRDGQSYNGNPVSITGIDKTSTSEDGLVDTYTITYTDGTTDTFTVTNGKNGTDGKNGEDGTDVTALDLYNTYKAQTGRDVTYEEFLSVYLTGKGSTADTHRVIASVLRSVGKVHCEYVEADELGKQGPVMYSGSFVVYKIEADYTYFLTNYHVVYNANAIGSKVAEKIRFYLYGSEYTPYKAQSLYDGAYIEYGDLAITGEYVGGAATYDVAIFRARTEDVMRVNDAIVPVTFADDYHVGETAIAIGNANGEGVSVSQGIVSVYSEDIYLSTDGKSREHRSMRIDTAVYHGNSGGGLFNAEGKLIGLVNAGTEVNENINYGIPLTIVKYAAENIMYCYTDNADSTQGVSKPKLGVTVTMSNSKYVYDEELGTGKIYEDIVVTELTRGGIAERLGLQLGDKLTHMTVDGVTYELNQSHVIGDLLLKLTPGTVVTITYLRQAEGETEYTEGTTNGLTIVLADLSVVE